jgi:hypothetical protein
MSGSRGSGKGKYEDRGGQAKEDHQIPQHKIKTNGGTGSRTGATKNSKFLADYAYEISSTSAQDYPLITKFVLHEILNTFKQGHYVIDSIKKCIVHSFDEQIAAAMLLV